MRKMKSYSVDLETVLKTVAKLTGENPEASKAKVCRMAAVLLGCSWSQVWRKINL
jgi:hypothetical protein